MKNTIIILLLLAVVGLATVVVSSELSEGNTANETPTSSTAATVGGADQDSSLSEPETINDSTNSKSLASSGIESVPLDVFEDSSIKQLDLSGNNLTGSLPSQIQKLKNLEVLDASDNEMTGVPAEIGQMSKLRVINFRNNELSGLPNELGNLSNLQTFDLRGNPNISMQDLNGIRAKIPGANILTD